VKQNLGALCASYLISLYQIMLYDILLFILNRNRDEIIIVTALSGLLLKLGEPQKALAYCRKVSNSTYNCEKNESIVCSIPVLIYPHVFD
jgi:hypothetical protein